MITNEEMYNFASNIAGVTDADLWQYKCGGKTKKAACGCKTKKVKKAQEGTKANREFVRPVDNNSNKTNKKNKKNEVSMGDIIWDAMLSPSPTELPLSPYTGYYNNSFNNSSPIGTILQGTKRWFGENVISPIEKIITPVTNLVPKTKKK